MKKSTKVAALILCFLAAFLAIISCSKKQTAGDGYVILQAIDSQLSANNAYSLNHNYYLDSAQDDYFPNLKRILPSRLIARSFSYNFSNMHSAEIFESLTDYTSADDYVSQSTRHILSHALDLQGEEFVGIFSEQTHKSRLNSMRSENTTLYRQASKNLQDEATALLSGNYFYHELTNMLNFFEDGGGIALLENASFTLKRGMFTARLKILVSDEGLTHKKSIVMTFDSQKILTAEVKVLSYRGKDFVTGRRDKLFISYKSGKPLLPNGAMDYPIVD